MVRRLVAVVLALLLAVQVVRNAAVNALVATDPPAAARAWPGHPEAQLALAMTEIGAAARSGRQVGAGVFEAVDDAASKAPLAVEPFLVRGVQTQLAEAGRKLVDAEYDLAGVVTRVKRLYEELIEAKHALRNPA